VPERRRGAAWIVRDRHVHGVSGYRLWRKQATCQLGNR
jgi:hypothetical protein